MMRAILCACSAAGVLTLTAAGQALTCSIGSVSGLSLGAYNVLAGSHVDSVGTIVYRCDDVLGSDSIILQLSRGSSSSYLPRTLKQGAYELEYNLYLDVARTTVWGDGSSGTSQLGPLQPEAGVDTSVPVYGRIEAQQNAQAGPYSDTVVVTVVF
jgi:spore coat protein U-like protein